MVTGEVGVIFFKPIFRKQVHRLFFGLMLERKRCYKKSYTQMSAIEPDKIALFRYKNI